ncbi:MAG: MBL fold metallo-hydrolase [Myxococcales bacterium]|nr:MBL fold metallo-hydrolase [Myxococcales bacterium]
MKITVLVENSSGSLAGIEPEFGLSLYIKSRQTTILMDTGASGLFAINANAMGIDLETVDWLVLSHGHYDHGGGLEAFFQRNRRAKAIVKRGADQSFYGSLMPGLPDLLHRSGLLTRYIGLDPKVLGRFSERIQWIDAPISLAAGVHVLTNIPHTYPLAKGNRNLLVRRGDHFAPDDFRHELLLLVEEDSEAVVFTGCAHSGVLNMLDAAHSFKPDCQIRSVVGGFHLNLPRSEKMSVPEDEVRNLATELGQQVTEAIHTGHCTGSEAFQVMKAELGPRLHALRTGEQFEA